ncbi:MAG: family 1 encapsulin nanocompartment shell protein [Bacteroidales bacterium]
MDILRKGLAPINDAAWEEINDTARDVMGNLLSARKFVDFDGPHGWNYPAVATGRLDIKKDQPTHQVRYGTFQVMPLVESRISFNLNLWELDNISRGAEDADLDALEDAARKMAEFEEKAIYYGFPEAGMTGLKSASEHEPLLFPEQPEGILNVIARGIGEFTKASIDGPYNLVLGTEKWQELMSYVKGYPLFSHIERMMGGKIIISPNITEGFMVSSRGGDFKLTIGQDLSIGYESHSHQEVQLYLTESFTFRVIEPKAVILLQ